MSEREKEMFDLSNVKINEKIVSGFTILDSSFAFNAEKNCRELILLCTKEDCIKQINNESLFNNLTFTFSIGKNEFYAEAPFAQAYRPIISEKSSLEIHFYVRRIYRKNITKGLFYFKLFNISKNITTHCYEDSGWKMRSRLSIIVASNNWELINYKYREKYFKNCYYINGILSLQTETTYEDAIEQMKYICVMLSFVSQKDVRCFEAYDENNLLVETYFNKAEPYGNDNEIINIFSKSSPSDLIKNAYTKYIEDSQWWATTLEYFIESNSARSLETKIMLHCMQLERLLNKFLPPGNIIIDANLDKNTTKKRYGRLHLRDKIKTFAVSFGIPYLSEIITNIRNEIAHNGVIGDSRKDYSSRFQLYKELELFIIVAILKIFKYNGNFTHHYFSYPFPEFKSMSSFVAGTKLSELCKMSVS